MNRIQLALGLLGAALSPLPLPGKEPTGIYLFPTPASLTNGDFERALAVPGVDGLAVVFDWSDLSPSGRPGIYDFDALDRMMATARAHRLAVELVIEAGKGVPEWMFGPPPAGLGEKRLDFVYSHHNGAGVPKKLSLAPPWDAPYQHAFADLLNQVAAHLRTAGTVADVAVVKLTGLNTESEELRLPAQTPEETGRSESTDSLTTWKDAGYRPARIRQAFEALAASFAHAFPGTAIALPVILANEFPPIDERGQILPRGRARRINAELLETLVQIAAKAFPNRFILQHDFLISDQPADPQTIALARKGGLPLAWQTNLLLGKEKGAGASGQFGHAIPCDEFSYLKLLMNGVHPAGGAGPSAKARYIEVFAYDAVHYPHAIAAAHEAMTR